MTKTGTIVLRSDGQALELALSSRDVHLLDGEYFPATSVPYRAIFGLDFVRGLGPPTVGEVLVTHPRVVLIELLEGLLQALEDSRDLITFSYQYGFGDKPGERGGGATSGFRVNGLHGLISVKPSGYCHVTLSEIAPTGRGRIVEIIDMRVKRELDTDDRGVLKVSRRAAEVGWFEQLPPVIAWLKERSGHDVEVSHG